MDAGLKTAWLATLLLAAGVARADLFLCVDDRGHRRIQDKPCPNGQLAQAHIREKGSRAPATAPAARSGAAGKPAIEVGIKKNKIVICELLDAEKRDTQAQIRGEAPAPAGESPQDNLLKIERQRSRVGCDVVG